MAEHKTAVLFPVTHAKENRKIFEGEEKRQEMESGEKENKSNTGK